MDQPYVLLIIGNEIGVGGGGREEKEGSGSEEKSRVIEKRENH